MRLRFLPFLLLLASVAAAQIGPGSPPPGTSPSGSPPPGAPTTNAPATSTTTTSAPAQPFGIPLDPHRGPWVLGDVKFVGNVLTTEFELESRVRARKGILYTPEDVDADVAALMGTGQFTRVSPSVYAIPGEYVPAGFATIAASTNTVRLVFALSEKGMPGAAVAIVPSTATVAGSTVAAQIPREPPPAAVSGVVLTPTAYRGLGHFNRPGLGLDFNAVYYIGRLYGKNNLSYTTERTNYLDRIGLWLLSADGKMQLQSEGTLQPAVAAGGQGILMFRDSPRPTLTCTAGSPGCPTVGAAPSVTASVSSKQTRILSDAYFVVSKNIHGVRASTGFMEGNVGDLVSNLTEFLSPESLLFNGHQGQVATSKSVFFASLVTYPKPAYPLGIELFKPNGMAMNPWLINFKLGYFLHLNFDVAYLKFQGGYDVLGNFQFRFNYFPSR